MAKTFARSPASAFSPSQVSVILTLALALLLLLPFGVAMGQLLGEVNSHIRFARQEALGRTYSLPLKNLLAAIVAHRQATDHLVDLLLQTNSQTNFQANSQPAPALLEPLARVQAAVEQSLADLDIAQQSLGDFLVPGEEWLARRDRIGQAWQKLSDPSIQIHKSRQENWQAHTTLVNEILALIAHVGDVSGLILDPELDSYYLMDTVVNQIPPTVERLAQIRHQVRTIAQKQQITPEDRANLLLLSGMVQNAQLMSDRGLRVAFQVNPDLPDKLAPLLAQTNQLSQQVLAQIQQGVEHGLEPSTERLTWLQRLSALGDQLGQAYLALYEQASADLGKLLARRIGHYTQQRLWIELFGGLVGLIVLVVCVAVVRSYRDRAQAAEAVQAAEAKYRSIVENAVEGIFQTTPDGKYVSANPALARIYGYDSAEELLANLNDIAHQLYVDPDRRQAFVSLLERQDTVSDFESEIYRKDGSRIWIAEYARAVRSEEGTLLFYEGTVEDITDRKAAEAALREAKNAAEQAN